MKGASLGVLLTMACLISCGPARYEKATNLWSEGYNDVRLDSNTYYVSFIANSFATPDIVAKNLLYRAAELADSTGHDYFVILDDAYLALYGGHATRSSSSLFKVVRMFNGTAPKDHPAAFGAKSVLATLSAIRQ